MGGKVGRRKIRRIKAKAYKKYSRRKTKYDRKRTRLSRKHGG